MKFGKIFWTQKSRYSGLTASLAFFIITLPFSNTATAQLRPVDHHNQVFVDMSVIIDSGANPAPPRRQPISFSGFDSTLVDPPLRMPVSRMLKLQGANKTGSTLSSSYDTNLIPPDQSKKLKTSPKRQLSKKRKVVLKKKPRKIYKPKIKSAQVKPKKPQPLPPAPPAIPKSKVTTKTLSVPAPPNIAPAPPPKAKSASIAQIISAPRTENKKKSKAQVATRDSAIRTKQPSKILFQLKESKLGKNAKKELDKIAKLFAANSAMRLQLMAFAGEAKMSPSKARRLSLSRALAIRTYLIGKGVRGTRIDVRALGNKFGSGVPNRVDLRVIGK
ncbi:MAG: OmpA family protein [Pseudomonadota bacterium]|nr:OmpA family protein [Pseudomonadota bacterium]